MKFRKMILLLMILVLFDTCVVMGQKNNSVNTEETLFTKCYYSQNEIISAYGMADIPADAKFKGRKITVNGVVRSIRCVSKGSFICLSDGRNNFYIQCFFEDMGKIRNVEGGLSCGDNVVVTGTCTGKRFNVEFENCTINKVIYTKSSHFAEKLKLQVAFLYSI